MMVFSGVNDAELDLNARNNLLHAKAAADAENIDNMAEQKRNQGKRVKYGDIIQVHVDLTLSLLQFMNYFSVFFFFYKVETRFHKQVCSRKHYSDKSKRQKQHACE